MKQNCQHCGELIVGNTYRVTSEEVGITLLDMIVCSPCSIEAKKLRLRTQKMNVTANNFQLEPEVLTRSRRVI
jgi:superfamily II helicase